MIRSGIGCSARGEAGSRSRGSLGRAALLATLAIAPIAAHAAPSGPERAQAEVLFNEGKKLQKEGKIPEACRKFEASYRIDPAGGTALNLGLCHETEGKLATAWGELKEALAIAKKANRKDREKIARGRIDAIEPKLPYVIVIPDKPDTQGLAVTIDDGSIEREAWGAQLPMDPGEHRVKATAPKHDTWESTITIEVGKKLTVRVPALAEEAPPPVETATAVATVTAAPVVMVPKYPWMRPSGIAFGSVGLVAVVVGAAFGANALSLGNTAKTECDKGFACTDAGFTAVQNGRTSATAADILLGAGAGFAALGTIFFVVGGATQPSAPGAGSARLSPVARVSPSGATFGVEGAW
jgi:hypothetical protein